MVRSTALNRHNGWGLAADASTIPATRRNSRLAKDLPCLFISITVHSGRLAPQVCKPVRLNESRLSMASQPQDAHLQDVTRPRYPSADGEHLPQTESPQDASASSPANMMPYNCQPCVRRKIKCDRMIPICTSCVRAKQDCVYQAPPKPRRKKRKGNPGEGDDPEPHEDVHQRLARYERILRSHGLLDSLSPAAEDKEDSPPISSYQGPLSLKFSGTAGPQGRLLSGDGKSRYVQSNLWLDTETSEDVQDPFDDTADEPHEVPAGLTSTNLGHNLISGALLGNFHDLLEFHPSHEHAAKLWELHTQNAEPLVRILHVKSTSEMVDAVSRNPSAATRAQECQLFAIYHFAVFSLEEDECLRDFGEERRALLFKYERALWQALINASWLKTTEMPVLQAVVLFLLCARSYIDPQTYWMLTGITVRIAQRMGLHRDGETLGLPPFEVQMRRRVFWQIILLDGFAGQHSGTGINLTPKSWDVKKPLNVGDNQIYPGMTEISETKDGATDMLFVLTRIELSEFFSRTNPRPRDHDDKNGPTKPQEEGLRYIDEVEKTIESKYLRYCDIISEKYHMRPDTSVGRANKAQILCITSSWFLPGQLPTWCACGLGCWHSRTPRSMMQSGGSSVHLRSRSWTRTTPSVGTGTCGGFDGR